MLKVSTWIGSASVAGFLLLPSENPREAEGFLQLFELVSFLASSEEHDGLFMAPVLHSFLPTGGGFEHAANLSASDMESFS